MTNIYISSCVEGGRGENKNGKWTRYDITDPKGVRYSAFNQPKYLAMVGQEIVVDVKEETVVKNGKTYLNRTIVEPKRTAPDFYDFSRKVDERFKLLEERMLNVELELIPKDIQKGTKADPPIDIPF